MGDPLARPFAYIPVVNVADATQDEVNGPVTLTPTATTTHPTGHIAGFDLLVNGVVRQSVLPGGQFTLDTLQLPDGYNDIRVLAAKSDIALDEMQVAHLPAPLGIADPLTRCREVRYGLRVSNR